MGGRDSRHNVRHWHVERFAAQRSHRHGAAHQALEDRDGRCVAQVGGAAVALEKIVLLLLQNNPHLACKNRLISLENRSRQKRKLNGPMPLPSSLNTSVEPDVNPGWTVYVIARPPRLTVLLAP